MTSDYRRDLAANEPSVAELRDRLDRMPILTAYQAHTRELLDFALDELEKLRELKKRDGRKE